MAEKGVKIGTEEEAFWTEVKDAAEGEIKALEKMLKLQRATLEMANAGIEKEQKS